MPTFWRCVYCHRKWSQWPKFKSWTRLFPFTFMPIPLFSSYLCVNSSTVSGLFSWFGNQSLQSENSEFKPNIVLKVLNTIQPSGDQQKRSPPWLWNDVTNVADITKVDDIMKEDGIIKLVWQAVIASRPNCSQFQLGLIWVEEGFMKNITLDQQGYLAYVPRNLAKASIVHIAPCDLMTSIVQQCTSLGLCATSPSSIPL